MVGSFLLWAGRSMTAVQIMNDQGGNIDAPGREGERLTTITGFDPARAAASNSSLDSVATRTRCGIMNIYR